MLTGGGNCSINILGLGREYRAKLPQLREVIPKYPIESSVTPLVHACALMNYAAYYGDVVRRETARSIGFTIDRDFTSNRFFVVTDGRRCILVFRGTDLSDYGDLKDDAAVFRLQYHEKENFRMALLMTRAVIHKHGKRGLVLAGHSLGGLKAACASAALRVPCHVFNPFWSPLETGNVTDPPKTRKPLVTAHVVVTDRIAHCILLTSNDFATKRAYMKHPKSPLSHGLENFILLPVQPQGKKG